MSRASTPRRERRESDHSRSAGSPVHTPGAPQGLVISKLGVQATATDEKAEGVMCLKIALPRDNDGLTQRWGIFSGSPPKLRSIPALYPLPASPALSSSSSHLTVATTLLGLPPAGSYPPQTANDASLRPYIDVSAATGQVFVCTDASPSGTGRRRSISREAGRDRSEWLVVVEFEVDIETIREGVEEVYRAVVPTPKCLDNVMRYLIVPKDEALAEVSIATEPKIIPLPHSVFRTALGKGTPPSSTRKHPFEEGWEDGEVHGIASEDEDEDEGSWLEGRFQSTDAMTLEWSFMPSRGSDPSLRVLPEWNAARPAINVAFEATIAAHPGPFGLEAVLPPGWGWSSLQIRADGLFSWRSADGQSLGALVSATASVGDDSSATLDGFSSSAPTPPIALAPLDAGDDFSFEQSSFLDGARHPQTPTPRRSLSGERNAGSVLKVVPRSPTPAALFECEFEPAVDEEDEDRVIMLEGTLQPLTHTLVSPDAAVPIPFFRFNDASMPAQASIICPNATFVEREDNEDEEEDSASRICDTTRDSVGTFIWTDGSGQPLPPRVASPVTDNVRVVAQRNVWGVQTISCMIPWPGRAEEIALRYPAGSARVVRVQSRGQRLPYNAAEREGGTEVRLHGGNGQVEVVVEFANDERVGVPSFPDGTGNLHIELLGDGWDKLLHEKPQTAFKCVSDRIFEGPMSPEAQIKLAPPTTTTKTVSAPRKSLARRLVSWNTLFHLLLLWIIVSLAQQVQRLRSEVAFVADEARDLRLYGFERATPPPPPSQLSDFATDHDWDETPVQAWSESSAKDAGSGQEPHRDLSPEETEVVEIAPNYGIGRVVFGRAGWQWLEHPTIHRLSDTVSWLWRAIVWLIAPA